MVLAAPMMAASGVRKSCETELKSRLRSRSVAAFASARWACSALRRARSVRPLVVTATTSITANVTRCFGSKIAKLYFGGMKKKSKPSAESTAVKIEG
jgi:hypothetical protein